MSNNTIGWLTNADIESTRYYAASCQDVPTLQKALEIERTYKKRKGAIQILERRIKQLTKKRRSP